MNKENNKKLKKYKGGRVKAAKGFPSFRGRGQEDERLKSSQIIQPKNKTEADKMRTAQAKAVQKAKPLPTKTPIKAKPLLKAPVKKSVGKISIGGVGGGKPIQTSKNMRAISLEERQANEKAQLEFEKSQGLGNQIIPNLNSGTLQTGIENKGVSAGKPISKAQEELNLVERATQAQQTSQAFQKAPDAKKEEELNIGKTEEQLRRDAEREATPVTPPTTFQKAPVQEDPRDSVVFAQAAQTAQQTASNEVIENLPNKLGFKFSQEELDKIAANVQAAIDEGVLNLSLIHI